MPARLACSGLSRACKPASCHRPPKKEDPGESDTASGESQRDLTRRPAVNRTDRDADCVQASGGDNKAEAVEKPTLAWRQFGAVSVTMEDGKETDQRRG